MEHISVIFLTTDPTVLKFIKSRPSVLEAKISSANFGAAISTIKLCYFSKKITEIPKNMMIHNIILWCFPQNFIEPKSPPTRRYLQK